ncbi:MAG: signal transduction histidine kinase, partial [Flavobacteriales bacterium]
NPLHRYRLTIASFFSLENFFIYDSLRPLCRVLKNATTILTQGASQRGASLTKKLLSYTNQERAEAKAIDARNALESSRTLIERAAGSCITLVLDVDCNPCPVYLDPHDLEDALLNLSINATHAIDGDGKITIQLQNKFLDSHEADALKITSGNYIALSVSDTGRGMDAHTVAQIFDPFFTTKGSNGTGLGLSQVYGFIERSEGVVNVYSKPGHGTQFKILFPRTELKIDEVNVKDDTSISLDYERARDSNSGSR